MMVHFPSNFICSVMLQIWLDCFSHVTTTTTCTSLQRSVRLYDGRRWSTIQGKARQKKIINSFNKKKKKKKTILSSLLTFALTIKKIWDETFILHTPARIQRAKLLAGQKASHPCAYTNMHSQRRSYEKLIIMSNRLI